MKVEANYAPLLPIQAMVDFVNLNFQGDTTVAFIRGQEEFDLFCRKYAIPYCFNVDGKLYKYCMSRLNPDKVFMFNHLSEKTIDIYHKKSKKYTSYAIVNPSEYSNCEMHLWDCLDMFQTQLRWFFYECRNTSSMSVHLLNAKFDLVSSLEGIEDIHFSSSSDEWNPNFMFVPKLHYIEDVINYSCILSNIVNKTGNLFSKVRQCENCENFYISTSSLSRFCSVKCRNNYHYKNRLTSQIEKAEKQNETVAR
jgi:hypothetical protein